MQDQARRIAADVLFPAAIDTDAGDRVPAGHLDLLAAEGFYGMAGPPAGRPSGPAEAGAGIDAAAAGRIIEILAGGCLATTFVWLQHHRAVRAASAAGGPLRDEWLGPLCRGIRRCGIALGGGLPGPPLLRAGPAAGGYRLDGISPWVTGWGLVDTFYVAARDERDNVVTAFVPAAPGPPAAPGGPPQSAGPGGPPWPAEPGGPSPTLSAELLRMVAVNASRTALIRFDGHFVPAGRVIATVPHRDWLARDAMHLRANGSLALGVAGRCCELIGASPLDGELARRRAALDAASPAQMPAARAAASELAMRAAAALVTVQGSRAILAGQHAQRLAREALFLLVFGSRPAIKERLAGRLTTAAT
jgi:alkylation response protein AidB-like acyl-CoA dehydrogenase